MDLKRFRTFATTVLNDGRLAETAQATECTLYRRVPDGWLDHNDNPPADGDVAVSQLLKTLHVNAAWRPPTSSRSFFPIAAFDAVLVIDSERPIRTQTRERVTEILLQCEARANYQHDATHDAATGLLNRLGFQRAVADQIRLSEPSTDDPNEAIDPTHDTVAVLFALDIDHFKQLNDAYGHIYGDIVIECLAQRLRRIAGTVAGALVARPSGEEFLLFMAGAIARTDYTAVAEQIRDSIAKSPLPMETEWHLPHFVERAAAISLPPEPDRRVTVSIGIASDSLKRDQKAETLLTQLRQRADMALYSAKAGGRNRWRHFADLLDRFGTVLEHHAGTDIVAIDIGKKVGVPQGQEFEVYHPSFDGHHHFVLNDGRTSRRLGIYPKHSIGRIVAFDVQPDVSFCRIDAKTSPDIIPVGSKLQAIPAGTITHLIGDGQSSVTLGVELASELQLEVSINKAVEGKKAFAVVACGPMDTDELLELRGSAFLNESLAALYRALRAELADGRIAQAERTQLVTFVESVSGSAAMQRVQSAIDTAASAMQGVVRYAAGIFHPAYEKGLSGKHALKFARYAMASAAENAKSEPVAFTTSEAHGLLAELRRRRQMTRAFEDYRALRELGLSGATFDNQGALAAFGLRPKGLLDAQAAIERAVAGEKGVANSTMAVIHANAGLIYFASDEFTKAASSFREARARAKLSHQYLPAIAAAWCKERALGGAGVNDVELARTIKEAFPHLEKSILPVDRALLEGTLAEIAEASETGAQKDV